MSWFSTQEFAPSARIDWNILNAVNGRFFSCESLQYHHEPAKNKVRYYMVTYIQKNHRKKEKNNEERNENIEFPLHWAGRELFKLCKWNARSAYFFFIWQEKKTEKVELLNGMYAIRIHIHKLAHSLTHSLSEHIPRTVNNDKS